MQHRGLYNALGQRTTPSLLLTLTSHLVLISNKVHTALSCADLKSIWLVNLIFSTFDGQASVHLPKQQWQCCEHLPNTMHGIKCSRDNQLHSTYLNYSSRYRVLQLHRRASHIRGFHWDKTLHAAAIELTGVTASDLNQNILPCFRTKYLKMQSMFVKRAVMCCYVKSPWLLSSPPTPSLDELACTDNLWSAFPSDPSRK